MTDDTLCDSWKALDDLLESERDALLSGDLEKIRSMLPSKEALIEAFKGGAHGGLPAMTALNGKLMRNQQLLNSASKGIRAAACRIETLHRLRGSLDTYDSTGKRKNIEVETDRSLERRA